MRNLFRVEESATGLRCSLACIRRFQLRARLGSPWRHRLSPLTDPTVRDYRSGFLKRNSPHHAKNGGYVVATRGVSLEWLHISRRSSRAHECAG
jgi:hypothetical protein